MVLLTRERRTGRPVRGFRVERLEWWRSNLILRMERSKYLKHNFSISFSISRQWSGRMVRKISRSELYQHKTYLECSVNGPKVCSNVAHTTKNRSDLSDNAPYVSRAKGTNLMVFFLGGMSVEVRVHPSPSVLSPPVHPSGTGPDRTGPVRVCVPCSRRERQAFSVTRNFSLWHTNSELSSRKHFAIGYRNTSVLLCRALAAVFK